jgi:hypothetical protein
MTKDTSPSSIASLTAEAGFEDALAAIVGSGWSEPPTRLDAGSEAPVPQVAPATARRAAVQPPQEVLEYQAHGGALKRVLEPPLPARREREADQEPEPPNKAILDIGLLSDFVTGSRSAEDTAAAAGVTINELHSALATTLANIDPKELAKAMGIQIAVTQLKAGAVFNALLADLVEDIRLGRAKADTKLELMKILKGVGRLEPKDDRGAVPGSGFQLNINIGGGTQPVTIDATN